MKFSETTKNKVRKYSQTIFFLLAWTLLICIVVQVFLAGIAIFVDASIWKKHLAFVRIFEYIPAIMYIFGSAGWVPQKYKAWSMMVFILINVQYYSTNGWIGAIHAVISLLIFAISFYVAWGAYKFVVSNRKKSIIETELSK